jgi:RNA:NAD 2'-phosphotransferase (TPT1/KptA family)
MELTKEDRQRLTEQHDAFVKQYNLFLEEIIRLWPKEMSLDEALLLTELRIHSTAIRHDTEAMAATLDKLGWWHRKYITSPAIQKEAAERHLNTN